MVIPIEANIGTCRHSIGDVPGLSAERSATQKIRKRETFSAAS